MGQLQDSEQSTSCAYRQGIIERAYATSRAYSRPARFPWTLRSAAALSQLAHPRMGAALEAIGRIRKFSYAAALFCHGNATGGRQRESGTDACGPSLGGLYTRRQVPARELRKRIVRRQVVGAWLMDSSITAGGVLPNVTAANSSTYRVRKTVRHRSPRQNNDLVLKFI
jgi:hypothetical protein